MPPQQFGSSDPERGDLDLRLGPDEQPPARLPRDRPGNDFDATAAAHLDHAVNALRRARPDFSAGTPTWRWQKRSLLPAFLVFGAAAILDPHHAIFVLAAVLVFPFFCVVALRAAALWFTAFPSTQQPSTVTFADDANLPRYTLLVPLYDEAEIAAELVDALSAIDYPADKLQILLILEELDIRTRQAVGTIQLPIQMSVVVVPDGSPRTKPRALNYALRQATGDLVVIYDAEDVPEPNQLRRAASLLMANPKLGCVQARLNVLNDGETWLTRQFAIEYTVLFDCILPALERLTLPVPLGGTSNHFSRAVLEAVGGWDPFNVTEDADLGIRLARTGWMVQVVNSTTWEEAPATFKSWRNQRTRWLKGWMQTYLVHMRKPLETARSLGWLRFFGFQVLMGGLILSALIHPWFYIVAAAEAMYGPLRSLDHQGLSDAVWVLGIVNLILGYTTGVALGWVAVAGRGRQRLAWWALLMPFYWLLISFAAYRALYQLATTPYSWEKTQHRSRAAFATRPIREGGEQSAADLA